ncbi:Hypp706 [Branchiostoma lanceolatum]|uniref:Hypp706 protein n=1 Tax=Branchiostoma lanceolatum TaxID=7740 RepID=A0A8J9VBY9_BRALA|nr:Hypp706 [Branchiostoma lanceolatum]
MNSFFPLKVVRMHHCDKPWLTPEIKALIHQRQQAFLSSNRITWKYLRNKIQRMIKESKKAHFNTKVRSLKKEDAAQWHKEIKSMAKMTRAEPDIHIEGIDPSNKLGIANEINKILASVIQSLPPIDLSLLPSYLPSRPAPSVEPWEVYGKLQRVRTRKAAGPDGIPGKLIKLFAYELSSPLADILNCSLQHGLVPEKWKCATVVPIPKSKPPSVNELRPISLTSLLGKVAESFVTQWTLSDILPPIDIQQFGCLKGRSTTHCLLDLTNEIFKATDKPDLVTVYVTYVRPVLEYAATIWHSGLTTTLSNRIEKVQRRAVRIIRGADYTSYTDA